MAQEAHKSQVTLQKNREQEKKKTYKQAILDYKASLGTHQAGSTLKGRRAVSPVVFRENEEDSPEETATSRARQKQEEKGKKADMRRQEEDRGMATAKARG